MTDFVIKALPSELFHRLFSKSNLELRELGVRVNIVDAKPGYPCRVTLEDAELGEEILLLNFEHMDLPTPYRACGPIFVRRNAQTRALSVNDVPESLRTRLLSVRGFDQSGMMIDAEVTDGTELEAANHHLFREPTVEFIQVHYAKRGCYACRVDRA